MNNRRTASTSRINHELLILGAVALLVSALVAGAIKVATAGSHADDVANEPIATSSVTTVGSGTAPSGRSWSMSTYTSNQGRCLNLSLGAGRDGQGTVGGCGGPVDGEMSVSRFNDGDDIYVFGITRPEVVSVIVCYRPRLVIDPDDLSVTPACMDNSHIDTGYEGGRLLKFYMNVFRNPEGSSSDPPTQPDQGTPPPSHTNPPAQSENDPGTQAEPPSEDDDTGAPSSSQRITVTGYDSRGNVIVSQTL